MNKGNDTFPYSNLSTFVVVPLTILSLSCTLRGCNNKQPFIDVFNLYYYPKMAIPKISSSIILLFLHSRLN